jgi:hypothetical protein
VYGQTHLYDSYKNDGEFGAAIGLGHYFGDLNTRLRSIGQNFRVAFFSSSSSTITSACEFQAIMHFSAIVILTVRTKHRKGGISSFQLKCVGSLRERLFQLSSNLCPGLMDTNSLLTWRWHWYFFLRSVCLSTTVQNITCGH